MSSEDSPEEFYFTQQQQQSQSQPQEAHFLNASTGESATLTLTSDGRGINIYPPCIYSGPSLSLGEKVTFGKGQAQHGKRCPTTAAAPKASKGVRLRGGCHNKYYELKDIKLQREDKRCKTTRVTDQDGKSYEHYGSISRGEELAYLVGSRKFNEGPSPSPPPDLPPSTCQANKELSEPRINSSRYESDAIQHLISDLAEVPMAVERAVRAGVGENTRENQQLLREATRKLNIQPSTKIYRDLLEISVVPEVNLKRITLKEKKQDPVPALEDYIQFQYSRVKPYSFEHSPTTSGSPIPNMTDDNANNDYDINQMDRMFFSQ